MPFNDKKSSPGIPAQGIDEGVARAEAELKDWSEDERHSLWLKLNAVMDRWAEGHDFRPAKSGFVTHWLPKHGRGPVDNATLLIDGYEGKDPGLATLCEEIDPDPYLALLKIFALVAVAEKKLNHPEGVQSAVRAFDHLNKQVRPLTKLGSQVRIGRIKGGKKGGAQRRLDAEPEHKKITVLATQLLNAGFSTLRLASTIAHRLDKNPKTIRRILQEHGLIKKRART